MDLILSLDGNLTAGKPGNNADISGNRSGFKSKQTISERVRLDTSQEITGFKVRESNFKLKKMVQKVLVQTAKNKGKETEQELMPFDLFQRRRVTFGLM